MFSVHKRIVFLFLCVTLLFGQTKLFADTKIHKLEALTHNALDEHFTKIESRTERLLLANGARVILHNNGIAPVAALSIKFIVGGYDEKPNQYGISHMLEHMLFKGTKIIGTTDYQKEKKYNDLILALSQKQDVINTASQDKQQLEKLLGILKKQHKAFLINSEDALLYQKYGGIGYNAYTSSDLTNYYVQLPSNHIALWAALESDRMKNAIMRSFYTERSVVQEERNLRLENQPRYLLMEKFKYAIYGDLPYGHSIIGQHSDIKKLNHVACQQFFRNYYQPQNMVITVVGNYDKDLVKKTITEYFASIASDPTLNQKPKLLKQWTHQKMKKRLAKLQTNTAQFSIITQETTGPPIIYFAWLKPPYDSSNKYLTATSLELLSNILADNRSSRLYRRLVSEEQLASQISISTGYPGYRDANLFLIRVVPSRHDWQLQTIQEVVLEEIHRPVTERELAIARTKNRLKIMQSMVEGGNQSIAEILSSYESLANDYQKLFVDYKNMNHVTIKTIQKATKSYLTKKNIKIAHTVNTSNHDKPQAKY